METPRFVTRRRGAGSWFGMPYLSVPGGCFIDCEGVVVTSGGGLGLGLGCWVVRHRGGRM